MADNANVRGSTVTDPVRNFRFLVTFYPMAGIGNGAPWKGRATFGFSSVDGLAVAVDTVPIREGGYNSTVHNIPLQITHNPVTLQRGVALGSSQNWEWMRWMYRSVNGTGNNGRQGLFRSDVEISVLSHPIPYGGGDNYTGSTKAEALAAKDDDVALRFMLYNALPTALIFSSLNAMDNALFVESLTLTHEGLDMKWSEANPSRGTWSSAPAFYA